MGYSCGIKIINPILASYDCCNEWLTYLVASNKENVFFWNSGPEVEREFHFKLKCWQSWFPGASRGHCSLTCLNSQRPPEFLVHNSFFPLLQLPGMRLHLRSSNLPLPNSYGDTVITFKIQVTSLFKIFIHQPWTWLPKYLFEYMLSVLWDLYPEVESRSYATPTWNLQTLLSGSYKNMWGLEYLLSLSTLVIFHIFFIIAILMNRKYTMILIFSVMT